MREIIYYQDSFQTERLFIRPFTDDTIAESAVKDIIQDVRREGDSSLVRYAKILDGATIDSLFVTQEEIENSEFYMDKNVKIAIENASRNIAKFHKAQSVPETDIETLPGVRCVLKRVPIERIGLYIPGGTAPLFSTLLMLAIPAKIAGCKEITVFTPPAKDGSVNKNILYSAKVAGIKNIVKAGGAQAIAAMAYGTESIKKCDKIFGPGNRYVSIAKQFVSNTVSVDMFAGPSELMVIADDTANSSFVAADLLSQAEHGKDSQVILLSLSESFAHKCSSEIDKQIQKLSRREETEESLRKSKIVVISSLDEAIKIANKYAPEHLIISVKEPWECADRITSAGSIFIGNFSPESAGDYASGTNHKLPTGGWAKSQGGITTDSFCRTYTIQEISERGLYSLANTIEVMSAAEGLEAHMNAVKIRIGGVE